MQTENTDFMWQQKTVGVLVMAYGTPTSADEIEAYYTHIRRGNPPSPEQLDHLTKRYEAIGGTSPLLDVTKRQVSELEKLLNENARGLGQNQIFQTYIGMKHTHPFIDEAVKQMVDDGIEQAVGIVLAPHYSVMSIGSYMKTAHQAAETYGLKSISFVTNYHLDPHFIDALVVRVHEAFGKLEDDGPDKQKVLFTAHSLPSKIIEMNDPYPEQLLETARAIVEKVGILHWDFAWQSAGQTGVPWLGPDILDVIKDLHQQGITGVLICPIGFVSDHLEVLYDIDIECKKLADELNIQLERTASLNDDPSFIKTLATAVREQLAYQQTNEQ
jgi:ferrochelatase